MEAEDIRQMAAAARDGDTEAFTNLIHAHKLQLYKMAYGYLGNAPDALEALQEVTFRSYLKIGTLKEPAYFSSWLFRILINYCQDEQKKRKRRQPLQVGAELTANPCPLPAPHPRDEEQHVQRMMVKDALNQLEQRYQTVIQLKYYQDWTITEIARTLEKPEGTIKTWLNKALKGLRSKLGKEEGQP